MKFKNKETGVIVETDLIYYKNKLKNNPKFVEVKNRDKKEEKKKNEEVVTEPLL